MAIFNYDKSLRDQERAQAFSTFYVQGISQSDLCLGIKNGISLPDGVNIAPGYASPDFNIIAGLVQNQEQIRKDIFVLAEQSGVVGVKNTESGIAK